MPVYLTDDKDQGKLVLTPVFSPNAENYQTKPHSIQGKYTGSMNLDNETLAKN